jgi:clan AA aspartic protease
MGLVHAAIELIRSDDLALASAGHLAENDVRRINVTALVDTGAYMLVINDHLRNQLALRTLDRQVATLADGSEHELEIVGPVDIRFMNRSTTVRAMLKPNADEVLLGAIPLEDMDVTIDPKQQALTVNPLRPYVAGKSAK